MYSQPVEGMLLSLDTLKKTITETIFKLVNKSAYRIKNTYHNHYCWLGVYLGYIAAGDTYGNYSEEDVAGPTYSALRAAAYVTPVKLAYKPFKTYYLKAKSASKIMYKNKRLVNNSVGSPWTEFEDLDKIINQLIGFGTAHPTLQFANQKRALVEILQLVLTHVVDVKFSLMTYHNFITQSFQEVFNGQREYMKWESETFKYIGESALNFKVPGFITNLSSIIKGVKGANLSQKNLINLSSIPSING